MITTYQGVSPQLGREVFVAPSADVIGRVVLGDEASIWYGCVLRGDVGKISVGPRTNIQDLSVLHITTGTFDTTVGADVTVGHRAILHGCTVEDHGRDSSRRLGRGEGMHYWCRCSGESRNAHSVRSFSAWRTCSRHTTTPRQRTGTTSSFRGSLRRFGKTASQHLKRHLAA